MSDGYNFKQLQSEILKRSQATDWELARKEWFLAGIIMSDVAEICLCGHSPIVEICTIRNRVTGKLVDVGNRCVKRFLGVRSDLVFAGLKKIKKDNTKSLNSDAIAFLISVNVISKWEHSFLENTMRKQKLSCAQMETRKRINNKVLTTLASKGVQGT